MSKSGEHIELWISFLQGESESVSALMRIYFKDLAQYGMRFTNDKELIKDVIQELFFNLWERRTYLSESVQVKPYLFACLRRLIYKKVKELRRVSLITSEDLEVENFSFSVTIDEAIIANESSNAISNHFNGLIESLPKRQREVIYLKFFQSFSREEISSILGITPQTVSNLLQIALNRLRVATPDSIFRL
ncbi:MAG: sigma-70 family RNA polymerase sigma factor [Chitinophagales bacterium]|jgi:RNA polymerase sigma factor (sigma-70 family)|nr:sigma-70 family RNA polymerase sigma factor [Chitinophagales bacterium]